MVLGELEEEEILTAYQSLSRGVPNVTPVQVQGGRKACPLFENIFFNMFSSISDVIELLICFFFPSAPGVLMDDVI